MTDTEKFSEDYMDSGVEYMRECLRDLKTVSDAESARLARERCKDRLTNAARIYKEIREEYEEIDAKLGLLEEEMETYRDWERRYRFIQGTIEDLLRGIIDAQELRDIAKDYGDGTKRLEDVHGVGA